MEVLLPMVRSVSRLWYCHLPQSFHLQSLLPVLLLKPVCFGFLVAQAQVSWSVRSGWEMGM